MLVPKDMASWDRGDLLALVTSLQEHDFHNINFAAPEHVIPQIVEALPHAIDSGLSLPPVYNASSHDGMEGLSQADENGECRGALPLCRESESLP